MTSRRSNPAIFAGLAGAAAWGAPTCAQALTVMGYEVPTSDPGFTFVAGCVTGAIVAGCGSLSPATKAPRCVASRHKLRDYFRSLTAGDIKSARHLAAQRA